MFSDSIRRQATSKGVFDRGFILKHTGAVTFTHVDESDSDLVTMEGTVDGNFQSFYRVRLTMDVLFDTVVDSHCGCPAFAESEGLCKHCVAMALAYHDDPEAAQQMARLSQMKQSLGTSTPLGSASADSISEHDAAQDDETSQDAYGRLAREMAQRTADPQSYGTSRSTTVSRAKRTSNASKPREAETSMAISNVISAYAKRAERDAKRMAAMQAVVDENADATPVKLIPTLSHIGDVFSSSYSSRHSAERNWNLKLRIQRGKASYVVKHVDELVHAWEQGTHFEYGKNLAFTHVHSAFDETSNKLMELISQVAKAQRAMYLSRDRYWYAGRDTHIKELPLSSEDAVKLLDLFQGGTIQFTPERFGSKPRSCQVVDGQTALDVKLARGNVGGFDLIIPEDAECLVAGNRMYLFFDGKARNCTPDLAAGLGEFYSAVLPAWYPLHIREADMAAFCAAVLPQLRKYANLTETVDVREFTPTQAEFTFRISLDEHGYVSCDTQVMYGRESVNLFDDVSPTQPVRDVVREIAVQMTVRSFFPNGTFDTPHYEKAGNRSAAYSYYSEDPWSGTTYGGAWGQRMDPQPIRRAHEPSAPWFLEDDDEAMLLLLTIGYEELSRFGDVLISENLKSREVLPAPSVSVTANVRSGLLDIAVDSAELSPEDLMAYLAGYRRKQRFVHLSNGDIVRIGESANALAGLAEGLGIREEALVEGVEGVPANRTLFVDALMKKSGVRFSRNEAFRAIVRDFDTVADGDFDVPETLAQTMRQYQCDGFQWLSMLGKLGFGGILADDMGLGKTLQMIAYMMARKRDCATSDYLPNLVVCPASLVYNWEAEVHRFAPSLDVVSVTGPKATRSAIIAGAADHDVLVTSYDLMKRDTEDYASQQFHCVVLDEAQYIKNRTTKVAKSAKALPAQVRFALTGTPIENRLSELWSIFDFLMPGILGSHEQFAARFEAPIGAGDEDCAKRLRALIGPFILRRLKEDVLTDLPEKDENVVYSHMEGEQAKLYAANANRLAMQLAKTLPEEFAQDKLRILAELTKLRQICCDPHLFYENYEGESAKLETCMELIRNAVDGGHRILLFSQFTSMLDIIAKRLDALGLPHLVFTGSTSKEERAVRVASFQRGDASVFLISLKAGGTGLNLTAADIVIHYDPWWNVAAQNQATDRAHRIGQTRNVSVFKLIAKDSIEENIVQMQEEKRHLAEQVIGGEAIGSTKLTREDILALLGSTLDG